MSKLNELIEKLCPKGVEYKLYKELFEIKTGKGITTKDSKKEGLYPIISGGIEPMGYYDTYNRKGKCVTISRVGANAGFVNYIDKNFYLNDKCFSIIPFEEYLNNINIKFLYYYTKKIEEDIIMLQSTGGVPTINTKKIGNLLFPVPPIEVQCEIVHILDNFVLELKEKLTLELNLRKKQYECYASELFLKTNAKQYIMEELAEFVYGYTDKAKENGNIRFIRITDINEQGYLKNEDIKYIDLNDEAKKSLLKKGDLVMARTGATYGKTLYFDSEKPSVYASFLIRIIPNNEILLNKYYWHFTKTHLYWEQAKKLVTTGGQPQFNTPAIKKVKVPIPTIEKQEKIVNILDRFDKLCNDISEGLPAEIEARQKQYEYYRDKLLTFKELKING